MSSSTPNISESEWEVMRVIWEKGDKSNFTAQQIIDALSSRKDWSPKTVKTLLNRLVNKSALGFEEEGKRYRYWAKVTQEQCMRSESRSFLHRVFGGQAAPMLNYFAAHAKLTAEEIAELKKILSKKEK
ncbi:MAG TPA: BlaI/MecI/CopY family transcriptional regulator [Tepidisphaeraceae bacterium]|nr:BlaI/MecI/CopY family transcriptional regulator [Tepidisphaeraceae bacterium]